MKYKPKVLMAKMGNLVVVDDAANWLSGMCWGCIDLGYL